MVLAEAGLDGRSQFNAIMNYLKSRRPTVHAASVVTILRLTETARAMAS